MKELVYKIYGLEYLNRPVNNPRQPNSTLEAKRFTILKEMDRIPTNDEMLQAAKDTMKQHKTKITKIWVMQMEKGQKFKKVVEPILIN